MFVDRNEKGDIIAQYSVMQYEGQEELIEGSVEYNSFAFLSLKKEKIIQIKAEAAKRIESSYPQYKQINNSAAVIEILNKENYAIKQGTTYTLTDEDHKVLRKAKECKDYISLIRSKSDELETLINSKRTIGTLVSIDISDDKYWI